MAEGCGMERGKRKARRRKVENGKCKDMQGWNSAAIAYADWRELKSLSYCREGLKQFFAFCIVLCVSRFFIDVGFYNEGPCIIAMRHVGRS